MVPFYTVAEDIEWLRDEWWFGDSDSLTDGDLRRGSIVLGQLLVDGLALRAWKHYGFEGDPVIIGPDLAAFAISNHLRLDLATVVAGGGRESGDDVAFVGAFRVVHLTTGVPADASSGFAVTQTSVSRGANQLGPADPLVERRWPLSEYLAAPAAARNGLIISRRDVIGHLRTQADVASAPPTEASEEGKARTEIIGELTKVHVNNRRGLYFELLSIGQAVGRSSDMVALAERIKAEAEKVRRKGPVMLTHTRPNPEDPSRVTILRSVAPTGTVDPDEALRRNVIGLRSLDVPVYRTFRLRRAVDLFRHGTMVLVAPHRWEDPFEDLLAHSHVVSAGEPTVSSSLLSDLRRAVFGQCWSLSSESDALWRIYSAVRQNSEGHNMLRAEEGIRVRTTPLRLLRALWNQTSSDPANSCFLGAVHYMPQREALRRVAEIVLDVHAGRITLRDGQIQTLLVKRLPFVHEREARLIRVGQPELNSTIDTLPVPIDPNWLFSQVALDPRLSALEVKTRTEELSALGFKRQIVQSDLYRPVGVEIRI